MYPFVKAHRFLLCGPRQLLFEACILAYAFFFKLNVHTTSKHQLLETSQRLHNKKCSAHLERFTFNVLEKLRIDL